MSKPMNHDEFRKYISDEFLPDFLSKMPKVEIEQQWRPIETAPKDGTWVLLWWKETPTGSECFDEWSPEQAVGKWHYDCWMRCSEYSVGGTPTHWMPLPKTPTK